MSRSKRPWDKIDFEPSPSEAARAKRRTHSLVHTLPIPNGANDDEDSDKDIPSLTYDSTSTPSSVVPSILRSSSISRETASPGPPRSNSVLGVFGEEGCSQWGTCYGMLLQGRMKLMQQSAKSMSQEILSSVLEGRHGLKLRVRQDATTILYSVEEIGVLDHRMAAALKTLRDFAPAVTFELFVGHEDGQDSCGRQGKKPASIHPLQIMIYGSDQYHDAVGSIMSDAGMYLQEPVCLREGSKYRNPHFFSWDNELETPLLLAAGIDPRASFAMEIGAILESTPEINLSPSDIKQDSRILTRLRHHQLSALHFMLIREDEHQDALSLWKPHNDNVTNSFAHAITQERRSMKPRLGKSLSLIALIIHTLNAARSPGHHLGEGLAQSNGRKAGPRPTLIVAPKSTLYNWELEIKRHTSSCLETHMYHGKGTAMHKSRLMNCDVVFTSYETVLSDFIRSKTLQEVSWFRVVLDEAHHIRNRTHAFQALVKLKTERRWCLTGTPVQNSLNDLFTLTEFLRFHPVEDRRNARRWILEPLGTRDDRALDNLRVLMMAVALRRSRDSVMKRTRSDVEVAVALSDAERGQYESIRTKAHEIILSVEKSVAAHNLLSYILHLRQLCSHGLYERPARSESADAYGSLSSSPVCNKCLEPLPPDLVSQSNVVKSDESTYCLECAAEQTSTPDLITDSPSLSSNKHDKGNLTIHLDMSVSSVIEDDDVNMDLNEPVAVEPGFSSKVHSVISNLVKLEQPSHADSKPVKSLVFSSWTTTLDALERALTFRNMDFVRIDGSSSLDQRRKAIESFQSNPQLKVMLLSFGSGSVGLNLTAATHVHLVEPQWNPMVEAQAAARVDRLDQDQAVVILRYIVKDSIEESIQARQGRKLWLAKLTASCTTAAGDPDTVDGLKELKSLVT